MHTNYILDPITIDKLRNILTEVVKLKRNLIEQSISAAPYILMLLAALLQRDNCVYVLTAHCLESHCLIKKVLSWTGTNVLRLKILIGSWQRRARFHFFLTNAN